MKRKEQEYDDLYTKMYEVYLSNDNNAKRLINDLDNEIFMSVETEKGHCRFGKDEEFYLKEKYAEQIMASLLLDEKDLQNYNKSNKELFISKNGAEYNKIQKNKQQCKFLGKMVVECPSVLKYASEVGLQGFKNDILELQERALNDENAFKEIENVTKYNRGLVR